MNRPVLMVMLLVCASRALIASNVKAAESSPVSTSASVPPQAATAAKMSNFEQAYRRTQAINDADALLKLAKDEEAAQRNDESCAAYLAAANAYFVNGNTLKSKPLVDKVAFLGAKMDNASKKALINALVVSGEASQARSRYLSSDYMFSAALALKEQLRENDDQLNKIVLKLAAVRGFQSQYASAETLYKRGLASLEATRSQDDPQVLACLSALATVSSQRGNFVEAAPLLQKLVARLQKGKVNLGLDNVSYFIQLSQAHRRSGQLEQANVEMDKALDIIAKALNEPDESFNKENASNVADALKEAVRLMLAGKSPNELTLRALKTEYSLRVRADGFDQTLMRDLEDIAPQLIKAGKAEEAADLYARAVKESGELDEASKERLMDNYLKTLAAANRTAEIAAINAEKQRKQESARKEAEAIAEKALADAKRKRETDPDNYVNALLSLAKLKMNDHRGTESMVLAREALAVAQKTPEFNDDNFIKSLWSYCAQYVSESEAANAKDDRFISDVINFDERQRAEHFNYGRCSDISATLKALKDRKRYAEAETLLKQIIAARKKYRAQDLVALSTGYENLCKFFKERGEEARYQEVRSIVLSFLAVRYRNAEPRTILPRLLVVSNRLQDGELEEAQVILDQVLPTVETHKESAASNQYRAEALNQLRRITDIYLVNDQAEKADALLRRAIELYTKGVSGVSPDYWLRMSFDKLADIYSAKGNYAAAEDLLKVDIAARTRKAGLDSEENINARLRLSELYLMHSEYCKAKGEETETTRLLAESEAEFNKCSELAAAKASVNSRLIPAIRSAERRRRIRPFLPLALRPQDESPPFYIRRHAGDLTNQLVETPREPLTFAVFGRSEVVMAGNATSWSCDSQKKPLLVMDAAGDVCSYGKLKLKDDARIHGNIVGRAVYMLQKKQAEDTKAIGNVPRPYPLPPALKANASLKPMPVSIKDGIVSPAPAGGIADFGDLTVGAGKTLKIMPGDYLATSFTLNDGAKVEVFDVENKSSSAVQQNVQGAKMAEKKPVRLFLRELPEPRLQFRLNAKSSLNESGAAARFQCWYDGKGSLVLKDGCVMRGVIYAPEALVVMAGNNTTLIGSVVADEVRMFGSSRAIFDTALPVAKQLGLPAFTIKPFNRSIPLMDDEDGGTIIMGGDPDYKDSFRAKELMSLGKPGAALELLDRAVKQEPTATHLGMLARCRILLKHYPAALECCNKALELEPRNAVVLATRGEVYEAMKETDKAVADYKRALKELTLPQTYSDLLALGVCYLGLGELPKSVEIFTECAALNPEANDAYEYRSIAYQRQNNEILAGEDRERVKRSIQAQLAKVSKPK